MNDMLYKHVLFKDLIPYLKRTDYLEGFTATEQSYIRRNIGAIGEDRLADQISEALKSLSSLSYDELLAAKTNKTLVPGYTYVIDNFQTMYQSNVKNENNKYITFGKNVNPSKVYKIIVKAITEDQLMSNVSIISEDTNSLFWIAQYDITPEVLDDGQRTNGKIIYLQDENKNEANYDFKNIMTSFDNKLWHTFSDINGDDNSSNCYNNDVCFTSNLVLVGNCNNNKIKGNNIFINHQVNELIGELNNVKINDLIDVDTEKRIIRTDDKYYIDYLDIETLTHQFYGIDNLFNTQ